METKHWEVLKQTKMFRLILQSDSPDLTNLTLSVFASNRTLIAFILFTQNQIEVFYFVKMLLNKVIVTVRALQPLYHKTSVVSRIMQIKAEKQLLTEISLFEPFFPHLVLDRARGFAPTCSDRISLLRNSRSPNNQLIQTYTNPN